MNGAAAAADPYDVFTEDFESFTTDHATITSAVCAFDSTAAENMWLQCNGTNHSSNTGPRDPHGGTWFALCETSGFNSGDSDTLTQAAAIAIASEAGLTPYLDFYYHAYGANVGTLVVEVEDQADTGTWIDVAADQVTGVSIAGSQTHTAYAATDPYDLATYDLSDFKGKSIKIRFRYSPDSTGTTGDIAIDSVRVRQDSDVAPTF